MSVDATFGDPVHYPKRRDLFSFDDEVASIFDNMAPRSIPMYLEVHRLHVSLFEHVFREGAVIADIGSSTGHLFRSIEKSFGHSIPDMGMKAVALDVSQPMMDRLASEFPYVTGLVGDITNMPDLDEPTDIMFCLYTLQFISPEGKVKAMEWLVRNLKVGGVLILGQKEVIRNVALRELFDEEYYKFRRDNGYTQAEIDAKTAALRNSMWPIEHEVLTAMLNLHHMDCVETSRWLQFSTVACIRRK